MREHLAHDLPLVEVVFCRSDLLIGLVSLPTEDEHIAHFRLAQRKADGLAPVFHDGKRRFALQKRGQNVAQDRVGVFGAWIIACENDKVRKRRGNASHAGALRFVAVSPAAKKCDHAPSAKPQTVERIFFSPSGVWA